MKVSADLTLVCKKTQHLEYQLIKNIQSHSNKDSNF